ncbi:MAG: HlyD family efflux transporter periplasmic adaptor subunit [Myxococcota bacterium]|nr:HlyD family efflux transporter periplasmic adaptor subunit [Myxococcota bacterium]
MTPFSQTLRAQEAEARSRRLAAAGGVLCVGLLLGWLGWFFFAELTLKAVSTSARLEASIEPYPVVAQASGRISASRVVVGAMVEAGQALVELDTRMLDLEIAEARVRRDSLAAQIDAARQELSVAKSALEQARFAATATQGAAEARATAAAAAAAFAEGEVPTLRKLRVAGSVSKTQLERAKSNAASLRALATAESQESERAKWAEGRRLSDRAAAVAVRESALVALEGELEESKVTLERLALDRQRHVIQAPITGRLGEVDPPSPGAQLRSGERVAVVVPAGDLKLIADFPPEVAVGHIRPGQRASMRLHGFPWLQYGVLRAEVIGVASEIRKGLLRVELAIDTPQASGIPLIHGLPGDVEIELEQISPASLTLRVAGGRAPSGAVQGAQ